MRVGHTDRVTNTKTKKQNKPQNETKLNRNYWI